MLTINNIKVSKRNLYETGLILIAANFIWMFGGFRIEQIYLGIAIAATGLLLPKIFYPISWLLMLAGAVLSLIVPKILLTVVFYVVVTPVGFLRKIMGKDNLKLTEFKKGSQTVFTERNQKIEAKDIVNPY